MYYRVSSAHAFKSGSDDYVIEAESRSAAVELLAPLNLDLFGHCKHCGPLWIIEEYKTLEDLFRGMGLIFKSDK